MTSADIHSIAGELEILPTDWSAYFDKETGEIISLSRDTLIAYENGDTAEEFSGDGDFESEMKLAEQILCEDSHFIILPSKFDVNEYSIMESFVYTIRNEATRNEMLGSIKGSGAFRRFKDGIDRYDLIDDWYKHKTKAYEEFVRQWAEENGLEVT